MIFVARQKHWLRGYFRLRVLALSASRRRADSLKLARRLASLPAFRRARTVALFLSSKSEIDTAPLLALCRGLRKDVALPVVDPARRRMTFHLWDHRRANLRKNVHGLWEPDPSRCPAVRPADIDLFLVPGRAFTPRGDRLGAGGGYYDRLFTRRLKAPRLGLAFDLQVTPRLPRAPHDRRLSGVLTPNRTY